MYYSIYVHCAQLLRRQGEEGIRGETAQDVPVADDEEVDAGQGEEFLAAAQGEDQEMEQRAQVEDWEVEQSSGRGSGRGSESPG